MASSSDVAVKFMTMVENKKYEGLNSMEAFFERRASDFAMLEFAEAEDEKGVKKLGVVGEHELVWTEHHAAYTKLVEEALGIPQFCEENTVTEKELFQSMAILVKENSDVQNSYFQERSKKAKIVRKRSNLNFFVFHFSSSFMQIIRNFFMKFLLKRKSFIKAYLGKVYKS